MEAEFEHLYGDMDSYFSFLNFLRTTGVTNMYGAPAYLRDEFDLNKQESQFVVTAWMQSFQ